MRVEAADAGVPGGQRRRRASHRELLSWAEGAGAECLEVSEAVLGKLAAKDNPQTMLGVFEQRWQAAPAAETVPRDGRVAGAGGHSRSRQPRHHHPHGRGRRRRAASCWSAPAAIPIRASAVRATMGSIFNVPLVRMDAGAFRAWAAAWPGDVVGTHLSATRGFPQACPTAAPVAAADGQRGAGTVRPSSPRPARGSSRFRWPAAWTR